MATNEDFERVIGHISIIFASWDFFVAMIITSMARTATDFRDLDDWTLAQKLRYLRGLKPEQVVNRSLLERIHSALPQSIEISRQRTRLLRDMWTFKSEKIKNGLVDRISLEIEMRPEGRKLGFQTETHSLRQLHELAEKVRHQHDLFLGFLAELPSGDLRQALRSPRTPG